MSTLDFSQYLSPFTWRYGSGEMRKIFSEKHKYELWRKIWVALATAQNKAGLVSKSELDDLKKHEKDINIERILEIEEETKHDVVAAIKEFAEKTKIGGGKIHLGATSMDVVDNSDVIKTQEALRLVKNKSKIILQLFSEKIKKYAYFPCIGYTHLQPAEPTTVGYRLAFYAQDVLIALDFINFAQKIMKCKGFKGAVGTAASYKALLNDKQFSVEKLEEEIMRNLGIDSVLISSQVYPRSFDFIVLSTLANLTSSLAKFAGDLRILQSPNYGEWSEPFGKNQVGSSAMPFKKNPISSENICSLARYVSMLPKVAVENASLSYLERTLDDSANKRIIMAEGFLATDQILITTEKIINGLVINEKRITNNLDKYAPFAATEMILMAAVKNGADRQTIHEILREISLLAWAAIQEDRPNPMNKLLIGDKRINKYLTREKIKNLLNVKNHIGNAPERALLLVKKIKNEIN